MPRPFLLALQAANHFEHSLALAGQGLDHARQQLPPNGFDHVAPIGGMLEDPLRFELAGHVLSLDDLLHPAAGLIQPPDQFGPETAVQARSRQSAELADGFEAQLTQ